VEWRRFAPYIGAVAGLVFGLLLLVSWKVVVVLIFAGIGYLAAKWIVGEQ